MAFSRRQFLQTSAAAGALVSSSNLSAAKLPARKAVLIDMLPKELPFQARFELAREVGFEAIEIPTVDDPAEAEAIKKAADAAKLPIHSVMNKDHWKYPLSSPDAEIRQKCKEGMKRSLDNAKLWGAETVLLVPAVVNKDTPYQMAWDTSIKEIKEMIPWAAERKVVIAVEEVWNKFMYSPREFAAYVDQFNSPWIKAYFDVGNCVIFGYPQDWIRTLGPRIAKVHLKDFRWSNDPATKRQYAEWVNLRDGQIDWKAVHDAFAEIGYRGVMTTEISGGDRDYLADVVKRVDRIFEAA